MMRLSLQHEALVDAGRGVAQHDLLAVVAVGEIAEREEVDAGDLQLGRRVGVDEARGRVAAPGCAAATRAIS